MNLLLVLMTSLTWTAPLSEADILGQADARIQQHRTGEATLKLVTQDGKAITSDSPAQIEMTRHGFLFGCNIFKLGNCKTPEDNAAYEKRFAELLNYATLPFYWWGYEAEQGKPNDEKTERIVRWCKAHDVVTKGHPLAWNYRDPKWIPKDPAEAMKLQFARIERCVRRFKGDIDIWDVVNEATAYGRGECWQDSPILTRGVWSMGVGPYVREAFKAARRASPDTALVINDYRTELDYTAKVIDELTDENRQPLYDIIGIQSHQHGGAWPTARIWEVCERFARYGKPLHFTETTFLSGKLGWDLKKSSKEPNFKWESTPEGEKRQAAQVVRFYGVLFSHPAVEAITWWDFTDQGAWQIAPSGLIRADMTPKPAYNELLKRIKGQWWTNTQAVVDEKGQAGFRGFFGDYRIVVKRGDRKLTGTFRFDKKTEGPIKVRLK